MPQSSGTPIRRRKYLASIGTVLGSVGIAGCGGSTDGEESNSTMANQQQETSTRTETTTINETPTDTPTPQIEPSAEVVGSEVLTAPFFSDGTGDEVPWIRVDVENSTNVPHREVRVETRLRASDGSVLATRERFTLLLPPNTSWRYYHRQDASISAEEISDTEHTVVQQETGIRGTPIDGAEVLNSSLSFDGSAVTITGEVDPGGDDFSRLTIVGLVSDSEGQFRGAVSAVETNPNATDTVAFEAGLVGFRTPPSALDPSNYNLRIINGAV